MMPPGWSVMTESVVRFLLRLSPELHEKLKAMADREDRSLHAQIIHLLKRAVAE